MSNATLAKDIQTISTALNKKTGKISLDEARTVIFETKNVSPEAQMTADDIVQAAWESAPLAHTHTALFTHGAVLMLDLTVKGMTR